MMGRSTYPRCAASGKWDCEHECSACAKRAVAWVRIEVSNNREEDIEYSACERHYAMVVPDKAAGRDNTGTKRFVAHVRTKGQWVTAKRTADKERRRRAQRDWRERDAEYAIGGA